MVFVALTSAEVDAKSPIDDTLMGKIKDNFDDLNSRVIAAGAAPFNIEVMGKLSFLNTYPQKRSIGMTVLSKEFTPSFCRFGLKKSGLSGSLAIDIRRHTSPKTPITGIDYQYSGGTTSIGRAGSALNTQSITRATPQISTQSITHAKAAINISSIIGLGTQADIGANVWQYNLASALDSDTVIGDSVVIASATAGANNGTFVIIDKNRGGGNNICVTNASGVAQTGAAGNVQPKIMSYNFTNPVDSNFATTYFHTFASHTSAANDGLLKIYAINQSGNNIWVKNASGVTQGGVAGNANTSFWVFALTAAALTTDYAVGEKAVTSGHTNPANDNVTGLLIMAVNSGGNNLVLYNGTGVAQAGVAGNINSLRWVYAMPTDPSSQVTVGDSFFFSGHSSSTNDGTFTIKVINRSATNNLVVYNEFGAVQGGAAGNAYSALKLVKFSSDQSAVYTTLSYVEMWLTSIAAINANDTLEPYLVKQVNRGGGANYNIVLSIPGAISQASPAGFVKTEMKSIFSSAPTLVASASSIEPDQNIVGSSSNLIATVIPANTPLMLYLTNGMTGDPQDFVISLL